MDLTYTSEKVLASSLGIDENCYQNGRFAQAVGVILDMYSHNCLVFDEGENVSRNRLHKAVEGVLLSHRLSFKNFSL